MSHNVSYVNFYTRNKKPRVTLPQKKFQQIQAVTLFREKQQDFPYRHGKADLSPALRPQVKILKLCLRYEKSSVLMRRTELELFCGRIYLVPSRR